MIESEEAFGGEFTFIVGVVRDGLQDDVVIEAINKGIDEAVKFIEDYPEQAVEILSKIYEVDADKITTYLYHEGMSFEDKVLGVGGFMDFMKRAGYLETEFKEEDVYYEN
jgi:ABC-type nitrate/sulfonate/bicarbonate transport system substrate-binding protein